MTKKTRRRSKAKAKGKSKRTPLSVVEKKIDKLTETLENAKLATTNVLDEEIERSKQIAVEVRNQLKHIRRSDRKT